MADTKSQSNLVALGVDINDPHQTISVYLDNKRAASYLDRRVLSVTFLAIAVLCVTTMSFPPDDGFLRIFGLTTFLAIVRAVLIVGSVTMLVGYVIFRSRLSKTRTEPAIKIDSEGLTFCLDPLKFNRMDWEELGDVAVKSISRPIFGNFEISGEKFVAISPENPNTLYKLAIDEKTKDLLGRRAAIYKMPRMERYRDLSFLTVSEFSLPAPLTLADLVILINTRRAVALSSRKSISNGESPVQELMPAGEKNSVLEIKRKEKRRLTLK